jgi:hypothetical protein
MLFLRRPIFARGGVGGLFGMFSLLLRACIRSVAGKDTWSSFVRVSGSTTLLTALRAVNVALEES